MERYESLVEFVTDWAGASFLDWFGELEALVTVPAVSRLSLVSVPERDLFVLLCEVSDQKSLWMLKEAMANFITMVPNVRFDLNWANEAEWTALSGKVLNVRLTTVK